MPRRVVQGGPGASHFVVDHSPGVLRGVPGCISRCGRGPMATGQVPIRGKVLPPPRGRGQRGGVACYLILPVCAVVVITAVYPVAEAVTWADSFAFESADVMV